VRGRFLVNGIVRVRQSYICGPNQEGESGLGGTICAAWERKLCGSGISMSVGDMDRIWDGPKGSEARRRKWRFFVVSVRCVVRAKYMRRAFRDSLGSREHCTVKMA
jgi:hypothetical protein